MTLGSLFDGSGGFPLAGAINGIRPVWSSEIEAYPMRVTEARFPDVKQLGDVTPYKGEIGRIKILGYMTRIIVSTFGRENEEYLMSEELMHPKWPEGGGKI